MCLQPTQGDEERWWRELQLAASASAGGLRAQSPDGECVANSVLFFNGAVLNTSTMLKKPHWRPRVKECPTSVFSYPPWGHGSAEPPAIGFFSTGHFMLHPVPFRSRPRLHARGASRDLAPDLLPSRAPKARFLKIAPARGRFRRIRPAPAGFLR